jgi:hypothetical protein
MSQLDAHLWLHIVHYIAADNYLDLLHLSRVSRQFYHYTKDNHIWYTAYKALFTSTLAYRHLPSNYWLLLFTRQVKLRVRWHILGVQEAVRWRPIFSLDDLASFADCIIRCFIEAYTVDPDSRTLAFMVEDAQGCPSAITLNTRTMVVQHYPTRRVPNAFPDTIDMETRTIIGAQLDESCHEVIGVWFQRFEKCHYTLLSDLTQDCGHVVERMVRFMTTRMDDSYWLMGIDQHTHRLVVIALELEDLVPRNVRINVIGHSPLLKSSVFVEFPGLYVLTPKDLLVPEVWSAHRTTIIMRLGGIETGELQAPFTFSLDIIRLTSQQRHNKEPLRVVLDTKRHTYVWEFVLDQPCELLQPAIVHTKTGGESLMHFYYGLALYTDNANYSRLVDLSGAGQVLPVQNTWRVMASDAAYPICEFDPPFMQTYVTSIGSYLYAVGGDQVQELNMDDG